MRIKPQHISYLLAAVLVAFNIGIFYFNQLENKNINYLLILIYFIGIFMITSIHFLNDRQQKLITLLSASLRAVVLCTLVMVIWAFLSDYVFPEVKLAFVQRIKNDLTAANQSITDIESTVKNYNNNYKLLFASKTIFTYGIFGAFFSLVAALSNRFMFRPK